MKGVVLSALIVFRKGERKNWNYLGRHIVPTLLQSSFTDISSRELDMHTELFDLQHRELYYEWQKSEKHITRPEWNIKQALK